MEKRKNMSGAELIILQLPMTLAFALLVNRGENNNEAFFGFLILLIDKNPKKSLGLNNKQNISIRFVIHSLFSIGSFI